MVLELIHQLNVINWNSGSSLLFSSAIISGGTSPPHDHKQMLAFIFTNNDVWKQERKKIIFVYVSADEKYFPETTNVLSGHTGQNQVTCAFLNQFQQNRRGLPLILKPIILHV